MRGRSVLVLLIPAMAGVAVAAGEPKTGRADLSGTWALVEGLSADPSANRAPKEHASNADEGRGARGGAGEPGPADLPLEVLGDSRRIVVTESESAVRVVYPSGRKRTFFLDGEERELDDGDGAAKVVAKRSGARGERIAVSSKWPSKRALKETWELVPAPRRLVVEGKVEGRESFHYRRTYEPAQPTVATATPAPPVATSPSVPSSPSSPQAATLATVSRTDCAIRPPKGTRGEELRRLVVISEAEAERRAVAAVAPTPVGSVISSDPEVDDGCLVWPFLLRLGGGAGVRDVLIDAGDGKVLVSRPDSGD